MGMAKEKRRTSRRGSLGLHAMFGCGSVRMGLSLYQKVARKPTTMSGMYHELSCLFLIQKSWGPCLPSGLASTTEALPWFEIKKPPGTRIRSTHPLLSSFATARVPINAQQEASGRPKSHPKPPTHRLRRQMGVSFVRGP